MRAARVRFIPPADSALLVQRSRLLDRLAAVQTAKVTLVQAPAGYGKTTLLADWHRRLAAAGDFAVWVPIEPGIGDPLDVYARLADALEISGIVVDEIRPLLTAEGFAATKIICAALSNMLSLLDRRVFIFIDDLHFVARSNAHRAFVDLLLNLSANTHLIIASREVPILSLGRLRARGELIELYAHDLRFAYEETEAFLKQAGQGDLSAEQISEIAASTEGWAAGLRLLSLALADRGRVTNLKLDGGSRQKFAAFFAEEVFASRTQKVRQFLLATSCVSRVCASLADALTGDHDAARLLEEIEASGLFLVSLDDDGKWYRYHHLFSDFLKRRLEIHDPEALPQLCGRAADWFADNGFLPEAFEHAIMGNDTERAAAVLDRRCQSMFYSGELGSFAGLAEQLPSVILAKFPYILFTQAWLLIISWRFAEAEEVLAASRERIAQLKAGNLVRAEEAASLDFLQLHREMMLALFADRMNETKILLDALAAAEPPADHYIQGTFYSATLHQASQRPQQVDIAHLDAKGQQHYRRTGSIFVKIWHYSVVGLALFRRGELHRAKPALDEAMSSARRLVGEVSELAAIPGLLLAELSYEQDDRAEAARLIAVYEELGRSMGYVDQRISALIVAVRLKQVNKDMQAVEWLLADAAALASAHGFERLRLFVAAEAARHYLLVGRPDQVARFVRPSDISMRLKDHLPDANSTLLDETRALLALRLAQSRGEFAEAAAISHRWADTLLKAGWRTPAVRWGILTATFEALNGDRNQARRTILAAAAHGQDAGLARSFLDGGEVVMSLISGRSSDSSANDSYLEALVEKWDMEQGNLRPQKFTTIGHFGETDLISALDALTEREIDILRRVGSGHINREIADAIGLTEGTVKWYLNKIYGKIGVSRRTQAVKRAKQMGIIL